MKIGLVRRGFSRTGGAEAYLRRFADAVVAAGHEAVLFTREWPRHEWPFDWIAIGGASPARFADALAAARPKERCDVLFSLERVWLCDAYRAGDGVHAAWLERRAHFEPVWKPWLRRFNAKHREILALEKQLFGPEGARLVIANSEMIRAEIARHFATPPERLCVAHNGVPAFRPPPEARAQKRRELGLNESEYVLLFAGTGWERKGLRFAIEAVRSKRGVTLLVAGRGEAGAFSPDGCVRFLGPAADMPALFAAADAFVLPTIYEPFSNACLEALAAGLPVITTKHNGFAEIIAPGIEGEVLADPADIAALAAAIERWREPARRVAIRPQLLALAARFSVEENVRKTLAALRIERTEK